jgi:hypothetical protein
MTLLTPPNPFTRLFPVPSAVVYDINGRESAEAKPVLEGCSRTLEQYIYCSSAGVYLKSDQMPHREEDPGDVKSRHKVRACVCVCVSFVTPLETNIIDLWVSPLNLGGLETMHVVCV